MPQRGGPHNVATIIDALVVQLELDTTAYKRSWKDVDSIEGEAVAKRDRVNKKNDKEERERARVEKQNALDRKKRTDDVTGSVATLGRTLAATFLGFESIEGGIKYLAGLNSAQADLGRNATKIGVGAKAMSDYGKAVELAGGKSEDATQTFEKLSREFSNLKLNNGGPPGPLLTLLMQKGVAFRDAQNNLLDIGTILDNLSKKTANMADQDRANLFANAGIAGGVINRMLEEQKLQDEQLDRARQMNNITSETTKHAEELKTAWDGVGQAIDRSGNAILETVSPRVKGILDSITEYLGGAPASGQSKRDLWGGASTDDRARAAREKYGNLALEQAQARAARGGDLVAPSPNSLAGRNNNPGNLKFKDRDEFRRFTTLAEGQVAERADLEIKMGRGLDTIAKLITAYEGKDSIRDPNATAAYIARASRLTGRGMNDPLTKSDIPSLMNAMTIVESGLPDSAMRGVQSGATPSIVSGGSRSGAGKIDRSGGNTTTVTVGKIEVNSSAADPAQVANQTGAALQRKISVAQANTGQQ